VVWMTRGRRDLTAGPTVGGGFLVSQFCRCGCGAVDLMRKSGCSRACGRASGQIGEDKESQHRKQGYHDKAGGQWRENSILGGHSLASPRIAAVESWTRHSRIDGDLIVPSLCKLF
jgi:hypothetical protein